MPLPTSIDDLSTTPGDNFPAGTDAPDVIDNVLREHASYIARLRDGQDPNLRVDLSTDGGADQIGTASGQTLQSKLHTDLRTVMDFMSPTERSDVMLSSPLLDHTTAVQAAINWQRSTGRRLVFPGFQYNIDTSLFHAGSTKPIDIVFERGAVLSGERSTSAMLLTLGGSLGGAFALGADVSRGATQLSVPGNTFSVGQIIRIQSTDLWNPTRAYYYKGELARVYSVAGDIIGLDVGLYDSYTAATTTITAVNAPAGGIEGLNIVRNSNHGGARIQYTRDFEIRSPDIRGANERCIELLESFSPTLLAPKTYSTYYAGAGTNYGVMVASCQHTKVIDGMMVGGRHGFAAGGTFPFRDLKLVGGVVDNDGNSGQQGLDTHGNGEFVELIGVHSQNGCGLQSINTRVIGGEFFSTSGAWALNFIPEIGGEYIEAKGFFARSQSRNGAVRFATYENNLSFDRVEIEGQAVGAGNTSTDPGVVIVGTHTGGWTASIGHLAVNCTAVAEKTHAGVNYALSIGANCTLNVGACNVDGRYENKDTSKGRSGLVNVVGDVRLDGFFKGGAPANYAFVGASGNFESRATFDCQGSIYVYFSTTGAVRVVGGGVKNATNNGGLYAQNSTDVQVVDFAQENVVNPIAAAAASIYTTRTADGRRVFHRSSRPTVGTFIRGDQWVNTNPSVGVTRGEMCTVGGVGGAATWVSLGNL